MHFGFLCRPGLYFIILVLTKLIYHWTALSVIWIQATSSTGNGGRNLFGICSARKCCVQYLALPCKISFAPLWKSNCALIPYVYLLFTSWDYNDNIQSVDRDSEDTEFCEKRAAQCSGAYCAALRNSCIYTIWGITVILINKTFWGEAHISVAARTIIFIKKTAH